VGRRTSVLDTLSAAEKGELLDQLLAAQPQLRVQVEAYAVGRLSAEDRDAVAEDVHAALCSLDIEELNGRAGYRPGVGYVDPGQAADEILDEALQPFLDDLARRGKLGMRPAAVELAVGILHGLYRCCDGRRAPLFEYTPDYAMQRASDVVERCRKLGIPLPVEDLFDLMPSWSAILPAAGA
jgi:hypothetical protein